MPKIHHRSAR